MADPASRARPNRRSQEWFGGTGRNGFIHRSWMRNQGFAPDVFDGRPVIGIATTWSELTPCNAHLRAVAEAVKRGVWEAGGFPLEFPVMSNDGKSTLAAPMTTPGVVLSHPVSITTPSRGLARMSSSDSIANMLR